MIYNNRDLSWLSFNQRVLEEAADNSVPLLERLRFLAIFSSNLDEFFRVRVPLISVYATLTEKQRRKIIPPPESELENKVQQTIYKSLHEFGRILNEDLIPQLEENKIILYYNKPLPKEFNNELKDFFYSKILTYIQPLFIRKSLSKEFFPESNKLYLMVNLKKKDEEALTNAFINIPTDKIGRFHSIFSEDGRQHIFFIDDIIRQYLPYIFGGYEVEGCYIFKITRNAELMLDEESYKGNLLAEIEKKLAKRDKGNPSRLLFESTMPLAVQQMITSTFGLRDSQMYEGSRYHNLSDLFNIPVKRNELLYADIQPLKNREIKNCSDIFYKIDNKDILLHFPYHSYDAVLSFFNQAAVDSDVESIYVTLYRVAAESAIVNALISAAKNGKKVVVFVEIKARFDEANNIKWSKAMKRAGVKIVYSFPGIKVHSKIALVKKRSGDVKTNYGFIGTGNFNESTARFYTDHALLTVNPEITADLELVFNALSDKRTPEKKNGLKFRHLLVSQNNMIEEFAKEINEQVRLHKKGLSSLIRIKVNNLEDIEMINLLYKASLSGVPVQLIVRSVCCVVPGSYGLSENIQVKRIVDRFLEHSRIFIFGTGNEKKVYMGSADLMNRNLYKRIEVVTPIYNEELLNELYDYFDIQWNDETKAVDINEKGENVYPSFHPNKNRSAQQNIYAYLKQRQNEMVEQIPG